MKHLSILLLTMMVASAAFATRIVGKTNNGKWSTASTWNLNRVPANNDTVVIPANMVIKVDGNEDLNRVVVEINGLLSFTNGKLRLDIASKVIVQVGGRITGGGNNDQLRINNILKYDGSDEDVVGYAFADATTGSGFFAAFGILPVQFVSFTATKTSSGILLSWVTENEMDNKVFEVQKSNDGRNWNAIGQVFPSNTTASSHAYAFTDRTTITSTTHYRVKQIDINGTATYTTVRTVTATGDVPAMKLYRSGSSVVVEFDKAPAETVSVRVISLNGQVIADHALKNSAIRNNIPVNAIAGMYVVQVITSDNTMSKKILL